MKNVIVSVFIERCGIAVGMHALLKGIKIKDMHPYILEGIL